jgi:hypothetical protein
LEWGISNDTSIAFSVFALSVVYPLSSKRSEKREVVSVNGSICIGFMDQRRARRRQEATKASGTY